MKTPFLYALFFGTLLLSMQSYAQVSFGKPEKLNDNWLFTLKDIPLNEADNLPQENWQTVDLPHDWSIKEQLSPTLAACTGYLPGGIGWYKKSLYIPQEKKEEKVFLYFEGVYNRSEVFINGKSLGKRPNGYISFMYDATPYVEYGKENTITVRVDHSQNADSRWYTGSGIYRNVWLIYSSPLHIAQWGIFAWPEKISEREALMNVEIEILNESDSNENIFVVNELINPDGNIVVKKTDKVSIPTGQQKTVKTVLKVKSPSLWNTETPYLYQLKTTLYKGYQISDQTITRTGFRKFTFDPDKGFALNGKRMKMKGVCLHHDAGVLGAAVPKEVWRKRLITLKEIGCNAIRTSHNPQAPELYELCDELGLLVMDEAFDEWELPKRKWLKGWNVGTPGFQGTYDFFDEWGEKDLADMVKRDRNHISIFAWSIGNEVDYPNDPYSHPVLDGGRETGFTQPIFGGYKKDAPDAARLGEIAKKLVRVVKQYDRTRPITAGLAGVAMSNKTDYPNVLDIAGYNYTESMYAADHKKYPKRVIYGSENGHSMDAWKAVRDNEYVFGQFLWTGIDYLGESARWPSRGGRAGLMDFCGFIKSRGYFRQSLWKDEPMIYISTLETKNAITMMASDPVILMDNLRPLWNYKENELVRVFCFMNTDKAKLELNGKIVGEIKNYDDNTGIIWWDIPFQSGKLEVVGMDKADGEVIRNAILTSGRPHALTIKSYQKEICKEKGISEIELQVTDSNGIPVFLSDDEVTCLINGPVKLLGMENGSDSDMSDFTDNKQRVYHGRMIAYLQATGEPGTATVSFSSPWLKSSDITIKVK